MKAITGVAILGAAILALSVFQISQKPVVGSIDASVKTAFSAWMKKHNISFKTPIEFNYRLKVFAQSLALVNKHNSEGHTYTIGLNQFSHLTLEEFLVKNTGLKVPEKQERNEVVLEGTPNQGNVDWRTKGAVNPVKNQGNCGSCWAFSATSSIESIWFISGHTLANLAEQQLVDCSANWGNQGCNGGWMDYAFKYVIDTKGQDATANYPYTAQVGTCKSAQYTPVATIKSYNDIPQGNCAQLLTAITNNPVSVAIAVNSKFQAYTGGVYSDTTCGTGLNHGVTAIGYGTDTQTNLPYWLVRNSWGASWGEQGYIRMNRNVMPSTGICGICLAASYPTN